MPRCSGQQPLRRTSRRAERDELGCQAHHRQFKLRAEGIDNLIDQPDPAAAGGAADHIPAKHPVYQLFPGHPTLIEAWGFAALLACLHLLLSAHAIRHDEAPPAMGWTIGSEDPVYLV